MLSIPILCICPFDRYLFLLIRSNGSLPASSSLKLMPDSVSHPMVSSHWFSCFPVLLLYYCVLNMAFLFFF